MIAEKLCGHAGIQICDPWICIQIYYWLHYGALIFRVNGYPNIAPDKALFLQLKSIDIFLISPQKRCGTH